MSHMTDIEQSVFGKKHDLKLYYDHAMEAFKAKDFSQAIKISENGLREAKLENNNDWINKFNSFKSELNQLTTNNGSGEKIQISKKGDLTLVKGVGPSMAAKLNQLSIRSVEDLIHSTPEHLSHINGIGFSTAKKLIKSAKSISKQPKLNFFSAKTLIKENLPPTNKIISNNDQNSLNIQVEHQNEVKNEDFNQEHHIRTNNAKLSKKLDNSDEDDNNEEEDSLDSKTKKPTQWFDDKFERPKYNQWYPPAKKKNNNKIPLKTTILSNDPTSSAIENESLVLNSPGLESNRASFTETINPRVIKILEESLLNNRNSTDSEKLNPKIIESIQYEAECTLEKEGYHLVNKNIDLKFIFSNIDSLALKIIRVNEHIDLLIIIPVKVNKIKGFLNVSEVEITLKKAPKIGSNSKILLNSYISRLITGQETIFHDLINEGPLFQILKKYLHMDIVVEKTITNKKLYFRSGPLQYKIIIQPLFLNREEVEISEKLLPYAYQKSTNIYALNQSQLSSLLDYIERKFFLLERFSEKKNSIDRYFNSRNSFIENIRLYSVPFMIFGVIFSFILLFQVTDIFKMFIGLAYASIGIYISVFGYLYYIFYREKEQIQKEFRTPYYLQTYDLDETALILINEELNESYMTQLSYECLKKNSELPIIYQIEKKTTEDIIKNQITRKRIAETQYLEAKEVEEKKNSKLNKKSRSTISSFLED